MASIKGTIISNPPTTSSHDMLLDKLIEFLTTNVDLVAENQQWTVLSDNHAPLTADRFVFLKGRGLAGTDEIFVNIRRFTIASGTEPVYNWGIRGAQSYDANMAYSSQPGSSQEMYFVLYDSSTPYWFFANGRRFIINARTLTLHTSVYCGLFLPYATQAEYPYPLVIMASTEISNRSYLDSRLTTVSSAFAPKGDVASYKAPAAVLQSDGVWKGISNGGVDSNDDYIWGFLWPYKAFDASPSLSTNYSFNIIGNKDNSIPLFPIILGVSSVRSRLTGSLFGELDGIFACPGSPYTNREDTLSVGSDSYVVVGDGFEYSLAHMAAIKEG